WYATYLFVAFLVAGPAFAAYANANLDTPLILNVLQRFFLLAHTAVAPLIGFAVLALRPLAPRVRFSPRALERAAAAVAIAAALALVPLNYGVLDRRDDHAARRYAMDVLSSVKPNGVLLAGGDG